MRLYRGAFLVMAGLICALALVSCGRAPESVLLRYHLNKGDKYELSLTTDQNITKTVMGVQQEANQQIGFVYVYDVKDVSKDGVATVKATFERVTLKMEDPTGTIDYDSSKPTAVPPAAAGFAGLAGQSFTIKMNDRGTIQSVEGADAMIEAVTAEMGNAPPRIQQGMREALKKQFGDEAIKESFGNMSDIFPATPVTKGEKWRKRVTLTRGLPMFIDSSWTLRKLSNDSALIDTTATIKPNPSGSGVQLGNKMKLDYQLNGTGSGTIEIDLESGFPKSSVFNQKITGRMTFSGPGTNGQMSMPVTIDGTVTLRSKKT